MATVVLKLGHVARVLRGSRCVASRLIE